MANNIDVKLFTGYKGVRLENLPEEAWQIVTGEGSKKDMEKFYGAVSWLYRCVNARAAQVANMPFVITQGDTVLMTQDDDAPEQMTWLNDLPDLLYRAEAAVLLCGQAYWFRERNLMKTLNARWVLPDSVRPLIHEKDGLTGFERRVGNKTVPLEVDDLVYFWPPDPFVELGPAENYPGRAALAAANVLFEMDGFLAGYFARGMVKATLLKYTDAITKEEGERVKEWWRRVATGVKNAFSTEVVRGDFETLVVGEGLKDLENTALTADEREAICTALGVPQSKVTANAANYATKQGDDLSFIQDTIAPECRWLASVINKQLLQPMGLRLAFKPNELSVMQEDEEQRSASLINLVNAGMPLPVALDVLGYDLPEDTDPTSWATVGAPTPTARPQAVAPEPMAEKTADPEWLEESRRFTRWAKKRTDPDPDQFESMVLSPDDKLALLEDATRDDAPFPGWESYP